MESKKINQLATNLAPVSTDLTIVGDPVTGVSKKITLSQIANLFAGSIDFYANLAAFPVTGNINIIFCAKDTQKLYLWSGSAYVEVFPSQAVLNTYQLLSQKGVSNGYASLDSGGKVPISQLPSSIMEYKGLWSAATNTPTLANGTGDTGDVYIASAAGTVNFGAGGITFAVGDYVIYSGSIWQRSSGAVGTVTSVGLSSATSGVTIGSSPVTTSGTITLAIATATTSQNGLLSSADWATFNAKQAALSGTGFVKIVGSVISYDNSTYALDSAVVHLAGTETITGAKTFSGYTTFTSTVDITSGLTFSNSGFFLTLQPPTLSVNRTVTLPNGTGTLALTSDLTGYVTAVTATSPLSSSGGVTPNITIALATTSANGYLSSTDFNIFNGKQAALSGTGFVKITGTTISYDNSTYYLASNPSAFIALTALSSSVTGLTYTNTTGVFSLTSGYSIPTTASQATWNTAYNDSIVSAAVTGTTTKTLTLTQQDAGTITASWTDINTDAVTSVFGRTGAVVAASADYNTSQVTENVANLYYTEARVSANTNVAANTAARHNALTIGTASGLSLSTQVLSLALATTSVTGALSSTDWATFNNKQSTVTLTTTGTSGAATFTSNTLNIPNYGSALSGYLPLTGGTLTGPLSGTSALFSGTVTAASLTDGYITIGAAQINRTSATVEMQFAASGNVRFFGNGTYPITFTASTGAATFSSSVTATNFSSANTANNVVQRDSFGDFVTRNINAAAITLTGAIAVGTGVSTFAGALTGTSATFSTEVTSSGSQGRFGGWASGAGYQGAALEVGVSGGTAALIGFNRTGGVYIPLLIGGGTNQTTTISGNIVLLQNNSVTTLTLAASGAATFSSSVQSTTLALGSVIPVSNGIIFNNSTANGANYAYLRTTATTVNTTTLTIGTTHGFNVDTDVVSFYNGAATFSSTIKTGTTSYGAGAIKLGIRNAGSAVTAGGYMAIEIDGTTYFLNLFTTTP